MSIEIYLLLVPLGIALLDWIAIARKWEKIGFVTKPGVIIALLVWLWTIAGFQGSLTWFALGLVFSLIGDIFLMLPRQQFISGLVAFALALVCYIIGFNLVLPALALPDVLVALLVGITSFQIYRRISMALVRNNQHAMQFPILVYSLIITIFLLSTLLTLTRPGWKVGAALACSAGGLLIYCSEVLLAWNRFVTPLPHGQLVNRILYQLGQVFLILGAAFQFG